MGGARHPLPTSPVESRTGTYGRGNRGSAGGTPAYRAEAQCPLDGVLGVANLAQVVEDADQGVADAVQLGGRQEIVQGEVLHQGTVVGHRGQGMLQACSGRRGGNVWGGVSISGEFSVTPLVCLSQERV